MKGGVRFDPESNGFLVIIHSWDNIYCHGEPTEWASKEVFRTEDEAMHHYKTYIRPALRQMLSEIKNIDSSASFFHQELE